MQINTLTQLKRLARADGGMECRVHLNAGLVSRKHVSYDGELFYVHNYIDESRQELTEEELMSSKHTNIGKAMMIGALMQD